MKEIQDIRQLRTYLKAHQIESVFSEQLIPHLSLYSYDIGESVCTQGEAADTLYVLVKGKLKIYTTSPEGKTLIVSFKTPLEVIGDIEYIKGIEIINTVEVVSPAHMIAVPYRCLNKYGQNHAPLLKFLLDVLAQKFYVKSSFLSFNLMYPVEVRLASYLLSICFDETDSAFVGKLSTGLLVDVANLIGTSYRHLNRVILKLSQEGLIERSKGAIVVKDKEGLRALAERNIYE
ncbi:Crp/Fnr family transcriptional regulator [Paenibacillus sp. CAA11]|uniref:Crp/Fnr family transcriptional regulator n=1 Tax=Paenibacillus sp. CAA11 TaxID=1532905 RepID=UPI000D3B28B3|nr:Crp/Fnr family transcriptional regulator [Paenibacillus sp. CAA11]AWB44584.1 Crp/Fnr family transcriptional regulator [Paenibacillus sp. CAA11]